MIGEFSPLVSIIIPVYNGGNYMREAIDSALAQNYGNFEVIVVNDGSTDNGKTDTIAKSYGDSIRYFSKPNGGCASALNFGIANMQGEYFSWLSHDDVYFPEKIRTQISILSNIENKQTIIYGGYEVIDSESMFLYSVKPDSVLSSARINIPLLPLLRGLIHGCSLLVPRKYFNEIGMFNEALPSTQDYALWFDFLRVAPLHFDSRILIRSRVHPDQGTHKIEKHLEECNELWAGFLYRLTMDEMAAMEGTPSLFLKKTANFLEGTPYVQAKELALSMYQRVLLDLKVSVVIPFYNRVAWTIEAIKSVQAQTHQNFEILLVDDGSTDELKALQLICQADSRIQYFRQVNSGPAKARNLGIEKSTGRYIAFLDADDVFYPDKLYVQLKFMEEGGWLISHTSYQRIDLEGNVIATMSSGTLSGQVFPGIMASCPIAMPTVMVRTDLVAAYRFPEEFEIGEDVCLWIALTSRHGLGGIDNALSKVRVGPLTAALNKRKQAKGLINIASYIVHDDYLSQYERQLRSLLTDASILFSETNQPETSRLMTALSHSPTTMLERLIRSIRSDGLKVTLGRIRRKIGI